MSDDAGHKSYIRSATMILMKAATDVIGQDNIEKIKVEFAIGNGYYCSAKGNFTVNEELVNKVKAKMQEYVAEDMRIMKKTLSLEGANVLFEKQKMHDKKSLFRYRGSWSVNVYSLDGYNDYYYGYMLPRTWYVKYFDLQLYHDGFLLVLPRKKTPTVVDKFVPAEHLFQTMNSASDWGIKLGIDTVGDLNDQIRTGGFNDMMLVQEALQERRISEIASDIVSRGGVKFVMIAGPSSSGKTTFSHRLSVQLRTHGLVPHPIGVDDYLVFC